MLVLRGGPLTAEKLLEHAIREQQRFSYRNMPMPSVSVDATTGGWTVDAIRPGRTEPVPEKEVTDGHAAQRARRHPL